MKRLVHFGLAGLFVFFGLAVAVFFGQVALGEDAPLFTWSSESGHQIKASFIRSERDKISGKVTLVLRKDNGQEVRVPVDILTNDSRQQAIALIEKQKAADRAKPEKQEATEKPNDTTTDGPKRTAAQMKAAENFKYGKVNFSTTLTQFRKLYPTPYQWKAHMPMLVWLTIQLQRTMRMW